MIRIATAFSGIGAVEHALDRLKLPHKIVFACDNGERALKISYEDLFTKCSSMNNSERNKYVTSMYNTQAGVNYVENSYKANYLIADECFYQDVKLLDGTEYEEHVDLFVGGSPCQSFSVMGKRGEGALGK